jgi:hypothetical protein
MSEIESRMNGKADFDNIIGVSITTDGSNVKSMTSAEWAPKIAEGVSFQMNNTMAVLCWHHYLSLLT